MGIAKLYSQSGAGDKINGIIQDYYAYAGENISAGDFVEFVKDETLAVEFISSTDLEDVYEVNEYKVGFRVEKI